MVFDHNFNLDDGSINWGPTESHREYHRKMFQGFLAQTPQKLRQACCDDEGRLVHILQAEHFDLPFLEHICEVTTAARRSYKFASAKMHEMLARKKVLHLFAQPSSRTFESFTVASSNLGMTSRSLRDLRTSSSAKGESDRDALRTHSSYFDAIVFRSPCDYFDMFALWVMSTSNRPIPIINGGSGKAKHPTQAILDYYTIRASLERQIDGKSFAFVGDCLRGRTVHSLAKVLALHKDIEMYFVAPEEYQIDPQTEAYLKKKGVKVNKVTGGLEGIPEIITGAVYMTRIQDEHDGDGEQKRYNPRFIFTEKMLDQLQDPAVLMHPLPKREEIYPAIDYRSDRKIMIWREMRNGMWTRTALFAHIFGFDQEVLRSYHEASKAYAPTPL
ncbi:hypothetical protein COV17_01370 [Candidatus Woesearchaeota archaeon CG10_big_fil_rev_8_21_14_0_10_36_11]|nr:MAG: hypothetical protein COV17_01370 [Candidatus Woesearchaeota archaeon CG10_big_fil_rev_8_21_14_0_10_36_11]